MPPEHFLWTSLLLSLSVEEVSLDTSLLVLLFVEGGDVNPQLLPDTLVK